MMQYLDTLFVYAISCSSLFVYGIGLEKGFFTAHPRRFFSRALPAFFLNAILSTAVLWFLITGVLLPYRLQSLVPVSIVLVCGIMHAFIALALPVTENNPTGEQVFFFGTVFLALYQADSFATALLIVCSSLLSFSIFSVILYAIRDRLASGHPYSDWKGAPLILISMGLLFIVLYANDISWWLLEILK